MPCWPYRTRSARAARPRPRWAGLPWLIVLGVAAGLAAPVSAEPQGQTAELPLKQWYERVYRLKEVETPAPLAPAAKGEKPGRKRVSLAVELPEGNEYFTRLEEKLGAWDRLSVRLKLPDDFPAKALVYCYVKDWDDAWLHVRCTLPKKKDAAGNTVLVLPIAGPEATRVWKPRGHHRPWHQMMPNQIAEFGIKFSVPAAEPLAYSGKVELTGLVLSRDAKTRPTGEQVMKLRLEPTAPQVGKKLEIAFQVTLPFRDPFNRDDVDLQALFQLPNGKSVAVRAFYFEDFLFDEDDLRTKLIPYGHPEFRVRYTPMVAGQHSVRVSGKIGGERLELPEQRFEVAEAEADWKGFVGRMEGDDQLLANRLDGSEFWGIGLNVRSPYDTRYMASFPFSRWKNFNLKMYRDLFEKYQRAGVNVAEVWMSPWWLALEWIPDAPGNHGVGYMNPWRSWKLDTLFEWAERYDIKLILVLNNHGKFSSWIDADWPRSPLNKVHGGPFAEPQEYFRSPVGREVFYRLADYLVARWGYSPNLLAWKLFTEIDLTGNNRQWYRDPAVTQWHRDAGRYIKTIDPNKHLVTTHWATGHSMVNRELAQIPELDMLTLDIYYSGVGARSFYNLMLSTDRFSRSMKKPSIVTEFGGSPHGDSIAHIRNQLHLGLWSGFMLGMASTPCFWWFPLVEEQDLYHEFRALANFSAGEQRRGATPRTATIPAGEGRTAGLSGGELSLIELRRDRTRWLWVFDSAYYFGGKLNAAPRTYASVKVPLPDLGAGNVQVEFWDCQEGKVIKRQTFDPLFAADLDLPMLALPPFQKDIAIKLTPVAGSRDGSKD